MPDPLTLLLDFRNVAAAAVANSVAADVKSPIARVSIEAAESLGAPASRVRITLSQPVAHHVRSERNTVVVDFDRPSAKAAPSVAAAGRRRRRRGQPTPRRDAGDQDALAADPIAALGLDSGRRRTVGFSAASSAPAVPRRPPPRPAIRRASALARHRRSGAPATATPPAATDQLEHRRRAAASSPATRSASISRAPTCAPCSAPSPRSAA